MTSCKILRTELLSYLMTKAESYSHDIYFKVKKMEFMGHSTRTFGKILGDLRKDGLVEKVSNRHTPSVWKTNLMGKDY